MDAGVQRATPRFGSAPPPHSVRIAQPSIEGDWSPHTSQRVVMVQAILFPARSDSLDPGVAGWSGNVPWDRRRTSPIGAGPLSHLGWLWVECLLMHRLPGNCWVRDVCPPDPRGRYVDGMGRTSLLTQGWGYQLDALRAAVATSMPRRQRSAFVAISVSISIASSVVVSGGIVR